MKLLITAIALMFGSVSTTLAEPVSAVNSHSCAQLKGKNKPFVLVLKKGENIAAGILQCANDAELSGATLSGLGAVEDTILTYFDHEKKTYDEKAFPQFLELVALSGNITMSQGKRVTHLHVALSNDQYQMFGGHLGSAKVGATAEISVIPMKGKLVKQADKTTGLDLIATK